MPTKPKADPLSARLRALMQARGLNSYRLAKKSGVTAAAIGRFLSGERLPSWETAKALAAALGCTLDDLC